MVRVRATGLDEASALRALSSGAIALRFAPMVRLVDGRVRTVLARLAALGPAAGWCFAPNTVRGGLDPQVSARVSDRTFSHAMAAATRWRRSERRDWTVAVEATEQDLLRPEFAVTILSAARRSGLALDALQIDCPTPFSRNELLRWTPVIHTLRDVGVRFAVRVSATNVAALERLHPTPFDEVRLVGGLVTRFAQSARRSDVPALSDLLLLAESTGTPVTAENVDDSATAASLRELGFRAASGSYFGQYTSEAMLRALDENEIRTRVRDAGGRREDDNDPERTAQPA